MGELTVEAQSYAWLGHVRIATPLSHRVWVAAAIVLGASLIALACFGHYTRREHVQGMLVPSSGLTDISARIPGSVQKIFVREGDIVNAGQPIIVLSGERTSELRGYTDAGVSTELSAQKGRLDAEIRDELALRGEQIVALSSQEGSLLSQISGFDHQIGIVSQQVKSDRELLEHIRPLAGKGYVSAYQLQQQEDVVLSAEAQIQDLLRQREATQAQLGSVRDQKRQVPISSQGKVDELRRQLSQAEQALVQNEADRATVISAPVESVVSSILVNVGQTVQTGQHVVSLMPRDAVLIAQMLVPSKSIGFVTRGTQVAMHYQAFPYQKFGVPRGRVIEVSRSALTPTAVTEITGEQKAPDEAMYRVKVSLDSQFINAYGKRQSLRPGMAVDADLLLDHRHLYEWVFAPLYAMRHQSLEEGSHE